MIYKLRCQTQRRKNGQTCRVMNGDCMSLCTKLQSQTTLFYSIYMSWVKMYALKRLCTNFYSAFKIKLAEIITLEMRVGGSTNILDYKWTFHPMFYCSRVDACINALQMKWQSTVFYGMLLVYPAFSCLPLIRSHYNHSKSRDRMRF